MIEPPSRRLSPALYRATTTPQRCIFKYVNFTWLQIMYLTFHTRLHLFLCTLIECVPTEYINITLKRQALLTNADTYVDFIEAAVDFTYAVLFI